VDAAHLATPGSPGRRSPPSPVAPPVVRGPPPSPTAPPVVLYGSAFACRASAPPAARRQGRLPPRPRAAPSPPDALTPTLTGTPVSPSNSSSPVFSALLCFAGTGKPDTHGYPPGAGTGRVFYPWAHLRAGKGRRRGYARGWVNVLPAHTRPAAIPSQALELVYER
jgi:hypothetical protein